MNKHISFEVFPPKKDGSFQTAFGVVKKLAELQPEFISVTYGAGGSHSKKTIDIASYIQNELNVSAVAHFTCVGSTKDEVDKRCTELKEKNISRILALRGDRPKDMSDEQYNGRAFEHATDLIEYIKKNYDFRIAAACYPEKHFEAESFESDLSYLKQKQDLGVECFISQLFFDNNCYYRFYDMATKAGIERPIHIGIMPITSVNQVGTTVSLSGSTVPRRLSEIIARYSDNAEDMYKAGIEYAVEQISDLFNNGFEDIHIYTMNKPEVAADIINNL